MKRAAAVVRSHLSKRQFRNLKGSAALENKKYAAASHAVSAKAFVTFDVLDIEELLVEARRAVEVVHVNRCLDDSGQRRHVLKSRTVKSLAPRGLLSSVAKPTLPFALRGSARHICRRCRPPD